MRPVLTSVHKGKGKKSLRATAIEYGLIAAGISVALIAVVNGLGPKSKSQSDSTPPAVSQPK